MRSPIRLFVVVAIVLASPAAADPVNITAAVLRKSNIAQVLADSCHKVAQGNEKECRITGVTLETVGAGNFLRLAATATIRSRHKTSGVTVYSWTTDVSGIVEIDATSCTIRNFDLSADNKIFDALADLFEASVRGKINDFLVACQ